MKNHQYRKTRDTNATKVDPADVPKLVGRLIHVGWAYIGCTWRIERVEGEVVHLVTRSSGKKMVSTIHDIYYTK